MGLAHFTTPVGTVGDPALLNPYDAAQFLGLSPETLKSWRKRSQRIGPNFIRVGRRIRYSWKDLRHYLRRRTVRSGEIRRALNHI